MPASRRELYQEGLIIPPTRLTVEEVARPLLRERAQPGRTPRRPARADRGEPAGGAADRASSSNGAGASTCRAIDELSLRRADGARGDRAAARRGGARGRRRGGRDADLDDPRVRSRSTATMSDRLHRHRAAVDVATSTVPLAVTRSACYFVVRCLLDPDVPANAGAFAPVRDGARGRLVDARAPAAVVAGNVETRPHHRRRAPRARRGAPRAGAGPGDDEQRRARRRRLDVLRDDRRRPGRERRPPTGASACTSG